MPINFPDNPSVNDEFESGGRIWKWNGITWDSVIASYPDAGKFIASTTAPQNPQQGQGWFDPDSAQFFIYYDNAWVEVGATLAGPAGADGPAGATGPTGPSGELTRNIRTVSTNTTLLLNDKNNIVAFTGSSLQTLTLANVLEPGSSVKVLQLGSGQVRLSPDTGVSLSSSNNLFGTPGQNTQLEVLCTSSGQYLIVGETASAALATGGTVSSDGTYVYHTFTSSGTFTPTVSSLSVSYLVVAGGGGGGGVAPTGGYHAGGGGGGAGGYLSGTMSLNSSPYTIVIGAGGTTSNYEPTNGSNTTALGLTAVGGGKGSTGGSSIAATNGGSGGGAGRDIQTVGLGTAGQGNNGGANTGQNSAGGGGGADAIGQAAQGPSGASTSGYGGNGGNGKQWLNGSYYAGGGAGGNGNQTSTTTAGVGGLGGGGNGRTYASATTGFPGTANTGGGGGGACAYETAVGTYGGAGGSGIVIIRYAV